MQFHSNVCIARCFQLLESLCQFGFNFPIPKHCMVCFALRMHGRIKRSSGMFQLIENEKFQIAQH
jgi:hypothetical protein